LGGDREREGDDSRYPRVGEERGKEGGDALPRQIVMVRERSDRLSIRVETREKKLGKKRKKEVAYRME